LFIILSHNYPHVSLPEYDLWQRHIGNYKWKRERIYSKGCISEDNLSLHMQNTSM
jgi:hypothetical protein